MTYELIGTRLIVAENPVDLDHLIRASSSVGRYVRIARLSVEHAGSWLADRGLGGVIGSKWGVEGYKAP
jgi:hypothetical protein